MSGESDVSSPVRHALPYPRRDSRMTRAPILAAISGVPSFELLSTTMTSVTRSDGRSARTRAIAWASLKVGMMTDTRMETARSPPPRGRPPLRQPGVNAPSPACASDREPKACQHRNQQFPYPRCAPLRNPKAAEKQKSHECGRTSQQTDDQQDAERNLGHGLHGSCDRGVAGRQAHDRLPGSRRVTRLDVVANQSCIAPGCVETFSQILEKDPDKHRAHR